MNLEVESSAQAHGKSVVRAGDGQGRRLIEGATGVAAAEKNLSVGGKRPLLAIGDPRAEEESNYSQIETAILHVRGVGSAEVGGQAKPIVKIVGYRAAAAVHPETASSRVDDIRMHVGITYGNFGLGGVLRASSRYRA